MKTVKISNKEYGVDWVTGKVVNQGKYTTTHGSGGGSYGNSHSTSVNISTTIHNDIFLLDSNGKEHSFQFSGWDIACREGNELTIVYLVDLSNNKRWFFRIVNNSTSQTFQASELLQILFTPKKSKLFLIIIAILNIPNFIFPFVVNTLFKHLQILDILMYAGMIIYFLFSMLISFALSNIIMLWHRNKKVKEFLSNFNFEEYK